MIYTVGGNAGAASSTAATAGLIKIDNPASATMAAAAIKALSVGPAANAEDSNYTVRLKRQSTAGTWTAATPRAHDGTASSVTTAGTASAAAGTAGNIIGGPWGFNQRGGLMIVAVPGAEWTVALAFSNGIILEYSFVQGTAVNCASITFNE